jgi:tetratricopeptide (TPR) repeat protein
MKPYRTPVLFFLGTLVLLYSTVVAAVISTPGTPAHAAVVPHVVPANNPMALRGLEDFYNMDYDKSIKEFEALQKAHPDDPFVTNYLLSSVLFKELYRIGALDTESYASDSFIDKKPRLPLDPQTEQRILDLATLATQQSEKLLAKNPTDLDALYARGVTRGLRSTYMGMAEKAWLGAVKAALGARRDHDRILELDPNYVDAKTLVGIHNYIIGSLSWPIKLGASIIGVTGNKQKGLEYLRQSAKANGLSSMDAKIALAMFLRREQKYAEALELVRGMLQAYPRNFLVAVEFANLQNAAGHGPEAIQSYRGILESYKGKKYSCSEPELAAYGLGISLRGQRHFDEAAEAFDMVSGFSNVDKDLRARSSLAAGEMYDTVQKRNKALNKYREVLAFDSNGPSADLARRHIKQPYRSQ